MNNAIFKYDLPKNEPILGYLPGSPERKELEKEIQRLSNEVIDIPLIIGGKKFARVIWVRWSCHTIILMYWPLIIKQEMKK
jgi:hypothetical protein